tara:strand:- start:1678 stop:1908 length:231 start_codon:yes stop_codon:yes gene_type:complete
MWKNTDNKLVRKFVFKDFIEVMGFVNKVAILSEKNNHHPEIKITYNTVTIELTTHDLGNIISEKDHLLSSEIDKLL